jgi:hypothetical protein
MAGDWVPMRVDLDRDPKVIAITDFLATDRDFMNWLTNPVRRSCSESAYEHVTRDVLVSVTVRGLLRTWGTARVDGRRDDLDLVLEKTDLDTIDTIAGIPGFGEAMGYAGWAVADEDNFRVTFPKFFLRNASTDELRREKDAARKRRERQKASQISSADNSGQLRDLSADSPRTVTPIEEKRTVKKNTPPLPPLTGPLAVLDTERFRAAWGDWLTHRKEKRKPVTATQAAKLLPQLAAEGEAAAVARIERAIANGYQGLIFPDEGRAANGARRGESFDDVIDRLSPKQEGGAP